MISDVFLEIAIVMVTAGVLSLILYKLRQPLIIAYMLTGVLVGTSLLQFMQTMSLFSALSTFGISFLLFIVGLNLHWRRVKDVGMTALLAGVVQITVSSAAGYFAAQHFGFDSLTSLFLGLGFAFSSTIIVVKFLSDKEDIDRLYGRIAVGILIVQDLVAMVSLLLLSSWSNGTPLTELVSFSLLKTVGVLLLLAFFSRFIIPYLFRYAAKSQELLFLIAIAWCFAVAAGLSLLGFSVEIGALLAGIALSGTGFEHEIEAKIRPLRDFFLIIFFIVLGTELHPAGFSFVIIPALAFTLLVLVGNPLVTYVMLRVMKHHPRTAFLSATTLGQVSEFAFILVSAGVAAKLIDSASIQIVTIVALLTITLSSYVIAFNEKLFEFLAKIFPFFKPEKTSTDLFDGVAPSILLIGYDRMGRKILPMMKDVAKHYKIIDINPSIVEELLHYGEPVMYGDAGSDDVLHFARADKAKMVISTVPDMAVNADIMDFLHRHHSHASAILTVKSSEDAMKCYELGATFVVVPSMLGGEMFANLLKKKGITKTVWGSLGKKERLALVEEE